MKLKLAVSKGGFQTYNCKCKAMVANVRIIYNNSKVAAIRTNVISSSLMKIQHINACTLAKHFLHEERRKVTQDLTELSSDLIEGRLTTRLLPILVLRKLVKNTNMFENTLYLDDPIVLYRTATVSLLSVDKKRKIVDFLLVFPQLSKEPTHYFVNLLNPPSTIRTSSSTYHAFSTSLPSTTFALPASVVKEARHDVKNIKKSDFVMRHPMDCGELTKRAYCRSFPIADVVSQNCMQGILTNNLTEQSQCTMASWEVPPHLGVHVQRGHSGLVLSAAFQPKIYGVANKRKELLATTHQSSTLGSCVWVPSRFSSVEIHSNGTVSTYIQQPRYHYQHGTTEHAPSETVVEFFNSTSEMEKDLKKLARPLTTREINDMLHKLYYIHSPGSRLGHLEYISFAALLLALFSTATVVCWKFGKCNPPWEASESVFSRNNPNANTMNLQNLMNDRRLQDDIRSLRELVASLRVDFDRLTLRLQVLENRGRYEGLINPQLQNERSPPLPSSLRRDVNEEEEVLEALV